MHPEEKIKDCEFYLYQLKHFEPDPYYTKYFFEKYLETINKFYQDIFEEANRDFGLFMNEDYNKNKFTLKAREKKDKKALDFVLWYEKRIDEIHVNVFPKFIRNVLDVFKKNKLSKFKIMLRAKDRYKDDIFQEIKVQLKQGKIRSNEELKIEIQRQLPVFLELINAKRKKNNEPKVNQNDVVASVFLDVEELQNMEIVYAVETYIPLMENFLTEARNQIKRLTQF